MNQRRSLSAGILFTAVCTLFLIPFSASAHVTGASWEKADGPNTLDIGYDPVAITAGNYENFNFKLRNTASSDPVPFVQVWVRVVKDKSTVLATGLFDQPIGPTTLLYQFDVPGDYTLEASFRDADGNDISTGSFTFTVQPGGSGGVLSLAIPGILFIAGVLCGGAAAVIFRRRSLRLS